MITSRRRVADLVTEYAALLAPRTEAPERFHWWVGVSIVAGALRRRVWIEQGTFRWYPHLYVILVGPVGVVKKSTSINIGARLLREVPGVHFGADVTTPQRFMQMLAEARDDFADGPVSLEDLGSAHNTATCALTCTVGELGNLLDPKDELMVNMLTDLWDGKVDLPFLKSTKTAGEDFIINPFVNIIAGTTPKWLSGDFRTRIAGLGLGSRCVFLYCDRRERYVAYPAEIWKGQYARLMQPLQETLIHIATLHGEYRYEDQAREFGRLWYQQESERADDLARDENSNQWLSYFLARKFDHVNKLAMILAASRRDDLIILLSDLVDAINRMDEVERELQYVFSYKHADDSRHFGILWDRWQEIYNALAKGIPVTDMALHARLLRRMYPNQVADYKRSLVLMGWLITEQEGPTLFYRLGPHAPDPTKGRAQVMETLRQGLMQIRAPERTQ